VDGENRDPWAPEEASLSFRDDGNVDVATGCTSQTTRWRSSEDAVRLDEFGWYSGCSRTELEQQSLLLDALSDGVRPTVEGDVLTLVPTGATGATLVYRAR
jgi:heat shock protein HslJ